jgi:hypothetical protein
VPGFFYKKEKLSKYKDSNFKNVLAESSGDLVSLALISFLCGWLLIFNLLVDANNIGIDQSCGN